MLTVTTLAGASLPSVLEKHSELGQDCGSRAARGLSETRT